MSHDEESAPRVTDEIVEARVRRAPKYGVFLGLGAAVGILVALILTFAFDGTRMTLTTSGVEYSQVQVFGFLALICVGGGLIVGGVVALILDRTIGRRTRTVMADRERVIERPDDAAA